MAKRIDIAEAELRRLYEEEKLSQREVAKALGCSQTTVWSKMQEYGIQARSLAEAQIIAQGHAALSHDFNGDLKEKAYLIGFCKGDGHVEMCNENGLTIKVECGSTKLEQIELFVDLFSPYGYIYTKRRKRGQIEAIAFLNLSFAFLLNLEDNIPDWILADSEAFFAFLAGYCDAEGHIGISRGRARFQLQSYDRNILHQAHAALLTAGIEFPRPRIGVPKGYIDKRGVKYHQDYWCLQTEAKASLLKLFERMGPYLRHAKRIQSMQAAIRNIEERNARSMIRQSNHD